MSRNYEAPRFTPKGDVLQLTKTIVGGKGDPIDPDNYQAMSLGAVGFNL